jgi:hypothetical protein
MENNISVKPDEEFIIALKEDHALGQNWMLNENFDQDAIEYLNSSFIKDNSSNNGSVHYLFKAKKVNSSTIIHFKLIQYKDSIDHYSTNIQIGSK